MSFTNGSSLVLLDGVAVLNHEKILEYDPMLVETFNIYPHTYILGARQFPGIMNLCTFKGNMPTLEQGAEVKRLTFQGCSYPVRYTEPGPEDAFRQTLYWEPEATLEETLDFVVELPGYEGVFEISVEGIAADGQAVSAAAIIR